MTIDIAPSSSVLSKLALLATILAPKETDDTQADGALVGKETDDTQADGALVGKLWKITIIKAGRALTGDEYPAEVLKDSVDIFRGLPIYSFRFGDDAGDDDPDAGFHHLPDDVASNPNGQPTGNLIGQVTDEVWWNEEEQSIQAFAAIDDEKSRTRFKNAYARGAIGKGADVDVMGFSIFAQILRQENRVAKFIKGESLDLVTRPAAGGAFVSIVAEAPRKGAPMKVSMLAALRAESTLQEDAIQRIVLQEVGRRVDDILWTDELDTGQKKDALVRVAEAIIGSFGQSETPGAIEAAVLEKIEAAQKQLTDDPKEGSMDAATITKLVGEVLDSKLAAAKAEDDAAAAAARAQDPIADLKTWLESLQGEERMTALQKVQSMLSEIGAMIEAGAGAGLSQDEFAALTAELQAVTEEKDGKSLRSRLGKVLESITQTDSEPSPEALELAKLKEELREQALSAELGKLGPELKLHNATAVLGMADLSGVTVKGIEVTGLREAIEAVIKDNPWVAGEAKAADDGNTGGDGGTGTPGTAGGAGEGAGSGGTADAEAALAKAKEEAAKAKAEADAVAKAAAEKAAELEALSAATIRESVDAGGVKAVPARLGERIKELQQRIRYSNDLDALAEYSAIHRALNGK